MAAAVAAAVFAALATSAKSWQEKALPLVDSTALWQCNQKCHS